MKFFSVLFLVIGLTSTALSAPIFSSKDWTLDDLGGSCVASTAAKLGNEILRFEVHLEKSGFKPVEFLVRTPGTLTQYVAVTSPLDERKKIFYNFGPLPTNDGSKVFWMIPRATDSFITYLRQQSGLPMRLLETQAFKNFQFSLAGSTATLDQLVSRCHPAKNISNLNFEKVFLPATVTTLDPRKVQSPQTEILRTAYHQGFLAYASKAQKEAELKRLQDQFAAQTKELSEVTKSIDKIQTQDLPALAAKKTNSENKITQFQNLIQQKSQEIQQITQELPAAEARLAAAKAEIDPLKPEHDRRKKLVETAQAALTRAQNRLAAVDQRITSLESEIRNLNNELSQIRNRIQSNQSALSRAQSSLSDAERENDRYDERREFENALRNDYSYQNALRDKQNYERELMHKRGEYGRAQRERDQARGNLQRCRGQQGADCNREQNELTQAENAVRRLASDISTLEWRIQSAENDIRRTENSVADDVRRKKERLLEQVERAEDTVRSIENEIASLTRRSQDIGQIEIPNRQNELASLRSEKPLLSQEIRAAETDMVNRQSELNQWKAQVDYDRKWAAFSSAEQALTQIRVKISDLEKEKQKLQTNLNFEQTELNKINVQINQLSAELSRLNQRKTELDQALANFNQEQTRLNGEIQSLAGQLQQRKQEFERGLPN